MANYSASFGVGGLASFNTNDGFLEAVTRGYRKGILTATDYGVLTQCDTLEDLKGEKDGFRVLFCFFFFFFLTCPKKKKKKKKSVLEQLERLWRVFSAE